MPIRRQPADDWDDDDYEDEEQDWAADEDDDPTVPCPHCGKPVFEDAPRCPHCGQYTSDVDALASRKPLWIIVGSLACLYMVWRSIFG